MYGKMHIQTLQQSSAYPIPSAIRTVKYMHACMHAGLCRYLGDSSQVGNLSSGALLGAVEYALQALMHPPQLVKLLTPSTRTQQACSCLMDTFVVTT